MRIRDIVRKNSSESPRKESQFSKREFSGMDNALMFVMYDITGDEIRTSFLKSLRERNFKHAQDSVYYRNIDDLKDFDITCKYVIKCASKAYRIREEVQKIYEGVNSKIRDILLECDEDKDLLMEHEEIVFNIILVNTINGKYMVKNMVDGAIYGNYTPKCQ